MTTPPRPTPPRPVDTLDLLPPPPKRSTLAKLAIILAVIAGINFGLCAVTTAFGRTSLYLYGFFTITFWICILGLLTIAAIAFIRSLVALKR
jgi:hypothetical protein